MTSQKYQFENVVHVAMCLVCSYGLLGASGCGKTTLLRCILSSLEPDYGEITVLGMEPGIRSSNVPGRDVGYMPQVSIHADVLSS